MNWKQIFIEGTRIGIQGLALIWMYFYWGAMSTFMKGIWWVLFYLTVIQPILFYYIVEKPQQQQESYDHMIKKVLNKGVIKGQWEK